MGRKQNRPKGDTESSRLAEAKPALSLEHQLAYVRYAPGDLVALRNYRRWVTANVDALNKLTRRLESIALPKIKTPIIQDTAKLLLDEVKGAHRILEKAARSYSHSMDGYKKFLDKSKREIARSETYDPGRALLKFTDAFGGETRLAREFKDRPEIIPPGIGTPLNSDAIRKRNFRAKKRNQTKPDK